MCSIMNDYSQKTKQLYNKNNIEDKAKKYPQVLDVLINNNKTKISEKKKIIKSAFYFFITQKCQGDKFKPNQ